MCLELHRVGHGLDGAVVSRVPAWRSQACERFGLRPLTPGVDGGGGGELRRVRDGAGQRDVERAAGCEAAIHETEGRPAIEVCAWIHPVELRPSSPGDAVDQVHVQRSLELRLGRREGERAREHVPCAVRGGERVEGTSFCPGSLVAACMNAHGVAHGTNGSGRRVEGPGTERDDRAKGSLLRLRGDAAAREDKEHEREHEGRDSARANGAVG